jgi:hypothetical protein
MRSPRLPGKRLPYCSHMPDKRRQSATRTAPGVRAALAVGLALTAIAITVVLFKAPLTVAGTNSVAANPGISGVNGPVSGCQVGSTIPRGTTAIRISASANTGPSVSLRALSGSQVITHGKRGAGWGVAETVTVPVQHVVRTTSSNQTCIAFGRTVETVQINGALGPTTTVGGETGRAVMMRIEYLRPGPSSWWSLASSVARRMGFGHAPSGTWIVFLLLALMISVAILTARLVLREMR